MKSAAATAHIVNELIAVTLFCALRWPFTVQLQHATVLIQFTTTVTCAGAHFVRLPAIVYTSPRNLAVKYFETITGR